MITKKRALEILEYMDCIVEEAGMGEDARKEQRKNYRELRAYIKSLVSSTT